MHWAEERRWNLGRLGMEAIPKAYAMLGENTISTKLSTAINSASRF